MFVIIKKYFILMLMTLLSLFAQQVFANATTCEKPFALHTEGNRIIDQCNQAFKLKGVNWYGAHEASEVPGGLDKQPLEKIVQLIKAGGFNSVRLTFSNQMLHDEKIIDAKYVTANPTFTYLKPIEVFDHVVKSLTDAHIVVILNNHTSTSEWCCGFDLNGLWHHPDVQSTSAWMNDWIMLAIRYRDNPFVAGFDLRNEVRTAKYHTTYIPVFPNWGNGDENDWKLAATNAGNAILNVNPNALIIIEGINWYGVPLINGYRPMLIPVKYNPVYLNRPNQLIYEEHVYSYTGPKHTGDDRVSYHQPRYRDMNVNALIATYNDEFGFVTEENHAYTAPVWIGEFGVGSDASSIDKTWFHHTIQYIVQNNLNWSIWSLNPVRYDGAYESYGLLTSDWSAYRQDWRNAEIKNLLIN